ncbi:MAG: hypothetical protein WAN48_10490 [Actinomycetes bacterium]
MSAPTETHLEQELHTLDSALERLVGSGDLTDVQAHRVHDAFAAEVVTPAAAEAVLTPRPSSLASRLIEVGAYLGAALVAAGGALVVGQRWDELGHSGQVVLLAVLALVFGAVGLVVVAVDRRRPLAEDHAVIRRLASTMFTLTAVAAAGLVLRLYLPDRGGVDDTRLGWMFLTIAVVSGAILVGARFLAPSALAEIGLYGTVLAVPLGLMFVFNLPDSDWMAQAGMVTFFAVGAAWAAMATWTKVLTVPMLGTVLGLGTALFASLGGTTTSKVLLAVLAVGSFAVYLVQPRWPWVTAAMLAAIFFTFAIVGDAFGGPVAMLVAGLLLLVLAALALMLQRRRHTTV